MSRCLAFARRMLRRFTVDRTGGTSIVFGITLVPIVAFAGAAIDYGRALDVRAALQSAVDGAALAAADKFVGSESDRKILSQDIFEANLAATTSGVSASPQISFGDDTATVAASASIPTAVLGIMHIDTIEVAVTATARNAPEIGPVCVLALDGSADQAFSLDGTADLTARECVVHANSRSDVALSATGATWAEAESFCAVGGHEGNGFSSEPIRNCSIALDPFADLQRPLTGGCDYNNKRYKKGSHTMSPGIYCGGITMNAHAEVTMEPGIYIIKDGPLSMLAHSQMSGTDVLIFLTGAGAVLDIKSHANIDIAASAIGIYAGLAIMQDRDSAFDETSTVEGGGTVRIVGTIYLPEQELKVGGGGAIGQDSPFMPLIAKTVKFHGNATIEINVDPDAEGFPDYLPSVRSGTPRLIS